MAVNAHLVHLLGHCLGAILFHQVCGNVVGTVGEAPLEGHGPAYPFVPVRTPWSPGVLSNYEGLRHVYHLVAGGHSLLHRKGIEERLYGRSHLALALAQVVIFEISVVGAAHISLHVACGRLYCHKGGAQEALAVADGIVRSHCGVHVSGIVPGKETHLGWLGEGCESFALCHSFLPQLPEAVTVAARLAHYPVNHLLVHVIGERIAPLGARLPLELRLEVASQLFGHGLFRILLHLVVDGGVYAQAVLIKVVTVAVWFLVLVEPAVEVVGLPGKGVCRKVLREGVVAAFWLLGVHYAAYHIPEVRGETGVVVLYFEGQHNWKLLDGICRSLGQYPVFLGEAGLRWKVRLSHPAYHKIPPLECQVRIYGRVVSGRLVDHSNQHCGLLDGQLGRLLGEESLGRRLDSKGVASKWNGIEIHIHYLVLGVVTLKLHGGDPLLELGPYHMGWIGKGELALDLRPWI